MAELIHKHSRGSAAEVKEFVQKALDELGYSEYVEWDGNSFSASAGLGMFLDLEGQVTDGEFIIEKSSGSGGGKVLSECKKIACNL